jgi:CRP-like cAMP-binding protein
MNKNFAQFNEFLRPYGLKDYDLLQLNQLCEVFSFNKGEIVFESEVKANCIYFICKGIIRSFITSETGEIKTHGFRAENMFTTGYALHNYRNEYRSKLSVECLEDCKMIKIPFTALKFMEESSNEAQKVARYLAENHIIELVDFLIEIDTKSLLDRFYNLDKKFSHIHQRVS